MIDPRRSGPGGAILEPILAMAVAGFLLATVSREWFGLASWHDSQRVAQCLLLVMVSALCVNAGSLRQRLCRQSKRFGSAVGALFAIFVACGVVSASTSGFVRFGMLEVSILSSLALLSLSVMSARQELRTGGAPFDAAALAVLLLASAAVIAPFIAAYTAALSAANGFYPEFLYRAGFSNPRFLGQFQTLVLPLLGACTVWPGFPPRYRRLAFVVLVLTWLMVIVVAGRATWYATAIASVVLLAIAPAASRRLLWPQAQALAVAFAGAWILFEWLPDRLGLAGGAVIEGLAGRLGNPLALSLRDQLWGRALELVALHPWLGIGPMGLALDVNPVAAHPHNAVLQIAAEWGVPAALALSAAGAIVMARMTMALRRCARPSRPDEGLLAAGRAASGNGPGAEVPPDVLLPTALLASLIAIGVQSMVDGVIVMPYTQVLSAVVLGWGASVLLEPAQPDPSTVAGGRSSRVHTLAGAIAAAALASALIWAAAPQLFTVENRAEWFRASYPGIDDDATRFWVQGWLIDEVTDVERFIIPRRSPLPAVVPGPYSR